MRYNTKDTTNAVLRGASCGIIACIVAALSVAVPGDSNVGNGVRTTPMVSSSKIAGVLLSPRTRLIIDYKRSALA